MQVSLASPWLLAQRRGRKSGFASTPAVRRRCSLPMVSLAKVLISSPSPCTTETASLRLGAWNAHLLVQLPGTKQTPPRDFPGAAHTPADSQASRGVSLKGDFSCVVSNGRVLSVPGIIRVGLQWSRACAACDCAREETDPRPLRQPQSNSWRSRGSPACRSLETCRCVAGGFGSALGLSAALQVATRGPPVQLLV